MKLDLDLERWSAVDSAELYINCCVYPIKVNQQRHVVEEILEFGKPYRLRPGGRQQAGTAGRGGDDDRQHADHLQRLQGRRVHRGGDPGHQDRPQNIIPVVEKFSELELIVKYAKLHNVKPSIGVRVKLAAAARPLGSRRAATAPSSG